MKPRAIEVVGNDIRIVASANGRTRYDVFVYGIDDIANPVHADTLNLSDAAQREKLIAELPPPYDQGGVKPLLLQLAAAVVADRSRTTTDAPTEIQPDDLPYAAIEFADDEQDGMRVLSSIRAVIKRYVAIGEAETLFLALWILHTYALEVADHTPYVNISAPVKQCGKSTLLDVLAGLVAKGVRVSSMSASFLFRVLDLYSPTLLIDEVSAWLNGPNMGELRGILNDGFSRKGRVGRIESTSRGGAAEYHPKYFRVWGAKALSGIGRSLGDELTDRSVPVRLTRASDEERLRLSKLRATTYEREAGVLRRRCARWVLDSLESLRDAQPELPASLSGRQQDIWQPLLAIADLIDPTIGREARDAATGLHNRPALGLREQLLADLLDIFAQARPASGFMQTEYLIRSLTERDDRPWGDMPDKHRPITARDLSMLLKDFDIESTRPRGSGRRGYAVAAFAEAWNKYLSDSESKEKLAGLGLSGTRGTPGT